jgi:hypothetical protein
MMTVTEFGKRFLPTGYRLSRPVINPDRGKREKIKLRAIREQHASTVWWKGGFVRDFEKCKFFHFEIP